MNKCAISLLPTLTAAALAMASCGAFAAAPRHVSNMPESPFLDTNEVHDFTAPSNAILKIVELWNYGISEMRK